MTIKRTPNGRWRARVVVGRAFDSVATFDSEVDASIWAARTRASVLSNGELPLPPKDVAADPVTTTYSLAHVLDYADQHKWEHAKDGRKSYRRALEVASKLGLDLPVCRLTSAMLREAGHALDTADRSSETLRKTFNAFRGGLTFWSKDVGVPLPPLTWPTFARSSANPRSLAAGEVDAFVGVLREPYRSLFIFLVNTGLQTPGEWRDLKASDVDLGAAPCIWVGPRSKGKGAKGRSIPLNAAALAALEGIPTHPKADRRIYISDRAWSAEFARARTALGFTDPRLTPYALRHTFATRLAQAGVPVTTLARLLGHTTLNQAMTYVTTTDDDLRAATQALDYDDEDDVLEPTDSELETL